MTKISVKAVLLGIVVDLGLSFALGALFGIGRAIVTSQRGGALALKVTETRADPIVLAASLVFGFAALILGGYVAGRIAGRDHLLHGSLVGAACIAVSLAMGNQGVPIWFTATAIALDVPMAAFGAVLAKRSGRADGQVTAGA